MKKLRKVTTKKAAKATARHSWRGFASKAKRQPIRSTALFGAGSAVGVTAGWLAGRRGG